MLVKFNQNIPPSDVCSTIEVSLWHKGQGHIAVNTGTAFFFFTFVLIESFETDEKSLDLSFN